MSEGTPTFSPLRPPLRWMRALMGLAGPLRWVVGFVVLGEIVAGTGAVLLALGITAASCLVSILVLVPMRRRRIIEEREGEPAAGG